MNLENWKLACELASVWMVGIVAIVAFVVVAVDRLNVRIAELEERVRALGGEPARPAPATASRVGAPAGSRPRSWSRSGSRC